MRNCREAVTFLTGMVPGRGWRGRPGVREQRGRDDRPESPYTGRVQGRALPHPDIDPQGQGERPVTRAELDAVRSSVASLNDLMAELAVVVSGDPEFVVLVRDTLREHSRELGFSLGGPESDSEVGVALRARGYERRL